MTPGDRERSEATPGSSTEVRPGDRERSETAICEKCRANRDERGRIINEILLTEKRYGRDLQIIRQVMYNFSYLAAYSPTLSKEEGSIINEIMVVEKDTAKAFRLYER